MTAVTDSDIRELKELIQAQKVFLDEQFSQVNKRLDKLEDEQININTSVKVIEARLDEWKPSINKITNLTEKVGELKN
jgi:hypothetical protein